MSGMQDIKRGQTWRRIKDGTLVEVVRLDHDIHGELVDVIWCEAGGRYAPLRACNPWAFCDRYELAGDWREGRR